MGDDRWALCKIACFDKEITNLNRAIGSAYIETFRQLAAHDMTYHRCLEAAGVTKDPVIGDAYRCWLEDLYDEGFFADDDGGHGKGEWWQSAPD